MDVFLDLPKDADLSAHNRIRLSDHGMTLMRLSYSFDLDSPNKEKIFQRILLENGVSEEAGEIYMEAEAQSLYPALMQFSQTIGKVCNMRLFRRETLHSLFEEMLGNLLERHSFVISRHHRSALSLNVTTWKWIGNSNQMANHCCTCSA